jgi:succinate dehydrogenase / fumarate reductase membrane anchor subunit
MSMRTPIARVRGLGAAKFGTAHWWVQRTTSLALIPLTVWFVASMVAMAGAEYEDVRAWLSSPIAAGLMLLLIFNVFYHMILGLQVIIEDYVDPEPVKLTALLVVKAAAIVLGVIAALSVLTILVQG